MLANSTSRSGSERWHVSLDGDDIAESLKAADEAVFEADSLPLVEVQGAEVLEWLPAAEDVVDDDENRVANGKSGFLESDAWDQAVQLGCKVGLSPTGRVAGFDQSDPQPGAPLSGAATFPLAGALAIPRAHPGPTGQMTRRRKAAHVKADLRQQDLGGPAADPRNRIQQGDQRRKRAHSLPDLLAGSPDPGVQVIDVC